MAQLTNDDQMHEYEIGSARPLARGLRQPAQVNGGSADMAQAGGDHGVGDIVEQAQREVARDQHPRRRVLRRGRVWLTVFVFGVALISLLAFAAHSITLLPGDLIFTRELQENRAPYIYGPMAFVSLLGTAIPVTVITVATLAVLWILRLRLEAVFVALGLLADVISFIIKLIVERSRPSAQLVYVAQHLTTQSFPSGHTVHYTVFYGFLALIFAANFRATVRRNVLIGICLALIVLVGPSRVYLGEHWLSDVVGGYIVGGLCLIPLVAGYLWTKERYDVVAHRPWLVRINSETTSPTAAHSHSA